MVDIQYRRDLYKLLPPAATNTLLCNMEDEIWEPVPIYDGEYSVSNLGRVKSHERMVWYVQNGCYVKRKERVLKQKFTTDGYLTVTLQVDKIRKYFGVHKLMALAFIENPKDKCCTNHIDGVKSNNIIPNLEWATISENQLHATRILGKGIGQTNGRAILTEDQVLEIRQRLLNTKRIPRSEFSKEYGISKTVIAKIVRRELWKHI